MQKGPKHERNREMYEARQNGEMYTSIAARHGITPSRAKVICDDYERALKYTEAPDPNEKYLVIIKGNVSTIAIKEVDRVYKDYEPKVLFWRNIGSKTASTVRIDKQKVIFKTGYLEEAEKFVDDFLDAVEKEKRRHELAMIKILAPIT